MLVSLWSLNDRPAFWFWGEIINAFHNNQILKYVHSFTQKSHFYLSRRYINVTAQTYVGKEIALFIIIIENVPLRGLVKPVLPLSGMVFSSYEYGTVVKTVLSILLHQKSKQQNNLKNFLKIQCSHTHVGVCKI